MTPYTQSLIRKVRQRAFEGGPLGSPGYQAAFDSELTKLRNRRDSLDELMATSGGSVVTSVSAGESVTFSTPMSVEDQSNSVVEAIEILEGRAYTITRTSSRFLY